MKEGGIFVFREIIKNFSWLIPANTMRMSDFSSYRRCVIEDYIGLKVGKAVMALVLVDVEWDIVSGYSLFVSFESILDLDCYISRITFCKVMSLPSWYSVNTSTRSGILLVKLKDNLGTNNSGGIIESCEDTAGDMVTKLITWNMRLSRKSNGLQVWMKQTQFHVFSNAFLNQK